jgi:hypothetical protein
MVTSPGAITKPFPVRIVGKGQGVATGGRPTVETSEAPGKSPTDWAPDPD